MMEKNEHTILTEGRNTIWITDKSIYVCVMAKLLTKLMRVILHNMVMKLVFLTLESEVFKKPFIPYRK